MPLPCFFLLAVLPFTIAETANGAGKSNVASVGAKSSSDISQGGNQPNVASVGDKASSDISQVGNCKEEIVKFCKDEDGKAKCLQGAQRTARKNHEPHPISKPCREELKQHFIARMRSTSHQGPHVFLRECAHDLETHCRNSTTVAKKVSCLRTLAIGSLQPSCKQRVFDIGESQAVDVDLDPALAEACKQELADETLCPKGSNIPGHRLACLRGQRERLNKRCKKELFSRDMADVADIRLNKNVLNSCRKELKARCDDVEFGETRKLHCLWRQSFVKSTAVDEFSETCRNKVHNLTRHSLQDYRLDFSIRNNCAKDISAKCSAEKKRVDSLTLDELFGSTTVNGQTFDPQAGQVISCLKDQLMKKRISSPKCNTAISRAVAVESASFGADPTVLRLCQADMNKFCVGKTKSTVHKCLRLHVSKIDAQCKAKVETHAVLEGEDITRNPILAAACKPAISNFCKDVQAGEGRVMHCLQDHRDKAEFPAPCKNGLVDYLESVNTDWRLKYGISTECEWDVDRLCKDRVWDEGGDGVLMCLKHHMKEVQRQGCKSELRRFVKQGVMNIRLAPATFQACQKDVADHCAEVEPGEHRVHDCLWKKRYDISPACAQKEFELMRITSLNAAMDRRVQKQCGSTVKEFCSTVAESQLWSCLGDRLKDPKMSTGCKALVESHIEIQHKHFDLNPKLIKFCKRDAREICGKGDLVNFNVYAEGEFISCLLSQRDQVKEQQCKAVLWHKAKEQTGNIALNLEALTSCATDIASFCPDVKSSGRGEIYNCLELNLRSLSPMCKPSVQENLALRAEDINFQPKLQSECKKAADKFCKEKTSGFLSGSSGKVTCLLNHVHDRQMDPGCADALIEEQNWRSKALMNNPGLKRHCYKDLGDLLDGGKCSRGSGEDGWKLNCLRTNSKSLKSVGCQKGVQQYAARISKDMRASAFVMSLCADDLNRLCADAKLGKARGHTCLQKQLSEVQNQQCKAFVEKYAKLQASSASMNFAVETSCSAEQKLFCKDIQVGEGRLLACLGVHLTQAEFGDACRKALGKTDLTKIMKKYLKTTALSFVDRYHVAITAVLVGFMVAVGLFVSHYIFTSQVATPVVCGREDDD